ncbi:hypothetical protein DL769_008397 [Monosporascus sp. CRB-8-3]|nr:hypothetical protein DL769_008397 [Monosporascus sp. CRB-8-3]
MYPESPRLESLGSPLTDVFSVEIRPLRSKKVREAREAYEFLESAAAANEWTADGGEQEADRERVLAVACRCLSEDAAHPDVEEGIVDLLFWPSVLGTHD